jgi:hypothetical protein
MWLLTCMTEHEDGSLQYLKGLLREGDDPEVARLRAQDCWQHVSLLEVHPPPRPPGEKYGVASGRMAGLRH